MANYLKVFLLIFIDGIFFKCNFFQDEVTSYFDFMLPEKMPFARTTGLFFVRGLRKFKEIVKTSQL